MLSARRRILKMDLLSALLRCFYCDSRQRIKKLRQSNGNAEGVWLASRIAWWYGLRVMPKFRLFPKSREEWMRAFLFLFQSYPVLAFVVRNFYYFNLPGGKGALWAFDNFEWRVDMGIKACLVVLFYSAITDLIMGRWRRGCLSICFAVFSLWLSLFNFQGYVVS
jgi:hypothetical protein